MSLISGFNKKLFIASLAAATMLVGCGGDDDVFYDDRVSECSQIGQNRFVYDTLQQWYFWDTSIPNNINPDNYTSVDSLLDAMVANAPEIDRFSYITDQQTSDDFFNNGIFVGAGFTSKQIDETLKLGLVFPGSPAAVAGLERGFEIVSVDGVSVADTLAAGNSVDFGESTAGTVVDIDYRDLDGNLFSTSITKAETNVPTVPISKVIDNDGVQTAYLFFYTFIEPSNQALANAFAQFQNEGAEELIVDVRYNGGGLISVANYLSGLIGGTTTQGQVLSKRLHNSQNTDRNETTIFSNEVDALDLNRVVFITTEGSASASELLINSLEPFLEVAVIGERTFGKPVGQYGFDFCGNTLFPVSFETVNALDQGQYFDGIAPTCIADDDLSFAIGNEGEASLASALTYLQTGTCPIVSQVAQKLSTNTFDVVKQYRLLDAH